MNNLQNLHYDLLHDHWEHDYDWSDIEAIIDTIARQYKCSVSDVRAGMKIIEQQHPKPKKKRKTWRNIEFKKPCRTCGAVIGFARTDAGKLMPVNLNDFTTHWSCEKPGKPKKKKGK